MTDYIRKSIALEALRETLDLLFEKTTGLDYVPLVAHFQQAMKVIEVLPSVDVVEVVRCKDCKHWFRIKKDCILASCDLDGIVRHEDYFCACGARKDGET